MRATYVVHVEAERLNFELLKQILNMSLSVASGTYKEMTGQDCKIFWTKA